MIVTTDAIILKSMEFRESSAIVTLYSRDLGKLTAMVKGARRNRSGLTAALSATNLVRCVVYVKPGRDIQLLTQCDLQVSLKSLLSDLEKLGAGMVIVEILHRATHADLPHASLFDLTANTLAAIDSATSGPANALYFFEAQLLDLSGFRPRLDACVQCGESVSGPAEGRGDRYRIGEGGVYCGVHHPLEPDASSLSPPAFQILRRLFELTGAEAANRLSFSGSVREEVGLTLRWLLRRHIIGDRPLKAEKVFSSIAFHIHSGGS